DADTFAWCEGMADWEPIGTIDEFRADVASAPVSQLSQVSEVASLHDEPTRVVGPGESPAAAGAFVSAAGAPEAVEPASEPAPVVAPSGSGLFSAQASSESISAFFATGAEPKPVEPASKGADLTDERH